MADARFMENSTAPELPASETGMSCDNGGDTGAVCSVLSIAVFLFLLTFWIPTATERPTPAVCVWIFLGSLVALLVGTILGIVGIVYRRTPGTLVIGIIGLSLNGLFLLGLILLMLLGAVAAAMHVQSQKLSAAAPAADSTQQVASNLGMRLLRPPVIEPPQVIYQPGILRPNYLLSARPAYIPQQPMSPIFPPQPAAVIVPAPTTIRRY